MLWFDSVNDAEMLQPFFFLWMFFHFFMYRVLKEIARMKVQKNFLNYKCDYEHSNMLKCSQNRRYRENYKKPMQIKVSGDIFC